MFEGSDGGDGYWTCSKDSRDVVSRDGPCSHIAKAMDEFQSDLGFKLAGETEVNRAGLVGRWYLSSIFCHRKLTVTT